jgi:TRAP-type C4-dicarboxylate transport system permease small subunit
MLSQVGNLLKRALSLAGRRAIVVVGLVLTLMVMLVVVDVTLRRVFNSPLAFSYQLMGLGLVIVVWGSILYSTILERHISVDVLVSRFPAKSRQFLRLTFDFVSAVILFLIGWQCIIYALRQQELHAETEMLNLPLYPFIFIVALGAIWAGLMLLLNFIESVRGEAKQ